MPDWTLPEDEVEELSTVPETGMGFQIVSARQRGLDRRRIILVLGGGQIAFDLSDLGFRRADDHEAAVLENNLRVLDGIRRRQRAVAPAATLDLHLFVLAASRIPDATTIVAAQAKAPPALTLPSALVKMETLAKPRLFYRYSAWKPDRRVDPKTGSFLAGTYATTQADTPFATTGFGAVGRYALPNVSPASYRYQIEAPAGTIVWFGTVAPQYDQAGGGVEAYFPGAVFNNQTPPTPPKHLDDE